MTEQISALADDEVALEEAEHLMASMHSNSPAAEVWSQYHLIGDVMRGATALHPNFKQNLMAKIELEPTVLSPNAALINQSSVFQKTGETNIKMPVAWSIAASFAAVMVVGWIVLQTQVTNNFAPIEVAQVVTTPATSSLLVSTEQAAEHAIPAEYLMAHQASAPTASSYYIQSASYSE
jgi:sigma-E factor negative regulatory protein RseA